MSSPSMMHEGVIALVRDEPAFAASLLRDLLNVEVPRFDEAQECQKHWCCTAQVSIRRTLSNGRVLP